MISINRKSINIEPGMQIQVQAITTSTDSDPGCPESSARSKNRPLANDLMISQVTPLKLNRWRMTFCLFLILMPLFPTLLLAYPICRCSQSCFSFFLASSSPILISDVGPTCTFIAPLSSGCGMLACAG